MSYKAENLATSSHKTGYDLVCLSAEKLHHRTINEEVGRLNKWTIVAYFKPFF
jgi:hypothetical protein